MAKRTVVKEQAKVTLDNISTKKGYAMVGTKGIYILARTVCDNVSFVKLGGTTKPVNEYGSLTEAIEDKLNQGFNVFEFDSVEDLLD